LQDISKNRPSGQQTGLEIGKENTMSRSRKDSNQRTIIRIIRREDGTFDLFLNRNLDCERIHEDGLKDILCVRFGYCGEEFAGILNELAQIGQAVRHPN
jgi:hypothetical protein